VTGDDLALALLALAGAAMRGVGLLVAGRLSPAHGFVRWANSVSVATVAAFVTLAVIAPGGALALIPWPARVAGYAVAAAVFAWRGGLLGPMAAGLAATLLVARMA
jgi:hypothetical protein